MKIKIEHHHYFHFPESDTDTTIRKILEVSLNNQTKLQTIMSDLKKFEDVLDRIDSATNDIAKEIADLKTTIAGQGLPVELEEQIFTRMDAAAAKLEGIGKATPETPVDETPVDEPTETPVAGSSETEATPEV